MGNCCKIQGCLNKATKKELCDKHFWRVFHGSGNPHVARAISPKGEGKVRRDGYKHVQRNGVEKGEHIWRAEDALGKPLPKGAQVHHVDGNKSHNAGTNLVVCPDSAYHFLIERRTRAFNATGNPNSKKCWICKNWDLPENLRVRVKDAAHLSCLRDYASNRQTGG